MAEDSEADMVAVMAAVMAVALEAVMAAAMEAVASEEDMERKATYK